MKKIGVLLLLVVSMIVFSGCSTKGYSNYNWNEKNMIKNPGFEIIQNNKIVNWESEGVVRSSDPKANSGKYYLISSLNKKKAITSQVIDITGYKEKVDKGEIIASFGGFQSGWKEQKDYGYIVLVFYTDKPTKINHVSTQPFYSNHWWTKREKVVNVPKKTRFIKYGFMGIRKEGTNNDSYLDDAFLYIGEKIVNDKDKPILTENKIEKKEEISLGSYFDKTVNFLSEQMNIEK